MVRVNLISPKNLTDQHLIAEYREILLLLGYIKRFPHPINIPTTLPLGKGHMIFFKNKVEYLALRHKALKGEMRNRGFKPNLTVSLANIPASLHNNWRPSLAEVNLLKKRICQRIREKPRFYRYYHEHKSLKFLINLVKSASW